MGLAGPEYRLPGPVSRRLVPSTVKHLVTNHENLGTDLRFLQLNKALPS
jgi:hypothetical protein